MTQKYTERDSDLRMSQVTLSELKQKNFELTRQIEK